MKYFLWVIFAFIHTSVFAAGIEGSWVGESSGISIKFHPGERWESSMQNTGGIYVVEGNIVTIDNFLGERITGKLRGNNLMLTLGPRAGSKKILFRRGNALNHLDATSDARTMALDGQHSGKVSEMILAMFPCRTYISEVYSSGLPSGKANAWSCQEGPKRYGTLSTSANGSIIFKFSNQFGAPGVDGRVVAMVPLDNGKPVTRRPGNVSIVWRCGAKEDIEPGQLMVESKYLPRTCGGAQ